MNTVFSSLEASYNPFALMVNHDRVLAAVHRSGQLNALASQVFRPLGESLGSENDEGQAHNSVRIATAS